MNATCEEIFEKYRKADFIDRMYIFLEYRELRADFLLIDQNEGNIDFFITDNNNGDEEQKI